MPRAVSAALLAALALAGCSRQAPSPSGPVRYVVGSGYQLGGTWFYPREDFRYQATGLATVLPRTTYATADGERYDPAAMVAAHQTLQLPAIARVTNMNTGVQVLVRVNDRGPASPARLIALSPRAATLLGIDGAAPVRVEVDEDRSLALREQLGGTPRLAVTAAPRTGVSSEALAPPSGTAQSARFRISAGPQAAEPATATVPETVPDRLPEAVTRVSATPGSLFIRAGSFGQARYADAVAARLARIGARVQRARDGRSDRFEVLAGPFATVAAADAALDQATRTGVSDARIVVE